MRSAAALLALVPVTGCARPTPLPDELRAPLESIRPDEIRAHMGFLAHDLLEGRETGTTGYEIAAHYVAAQLEAMRLEPAGEGGTFFQTVPLRRAVTDPARSALALVVDGARSELRFGEDFVLAPSFGGGGEETNAPLVFAGFGISAPELGYDDFAGIDVEGRILLVLSGAPDSFGSTERAYYSSRDTKSGIAAENGAAGLLIVQTPVDEARRPFARMSDSFASRVTWIDPESGDPHDPGAGLAAVGILSRAGAERLLSGAPHHLEEIFDRALRGEPPRFELNREVSVRVRAELTDYEGRNVAGRLPGSGSASREHVVYSAHLDHVGRGPEKDGDDIYNGAYDNASGVAVILAVARAFSSMPAAPGRSIVFLATAAEEEGLLGSDYFARFPTVEGKIVANVNADGALMLHPLEDVVAFGAAHSTILEPVSRAAEMLDIDLGPDFMPQEVLFVRSDQYSFVRQGVPAVFAFVGNETGNARLDGKKLLYQWMTTVYHQPSDDMEQEMDFEAGADYARLDFLIGYFIATAREAPRWNPGDFLGEKFGR